MNARLPLSVLLPTRNSMALLPAHIETMREWIELAEEVVVVDSESRDGTLDHVRANLKHAQVRLLSHPPGLYQSWNFGIAQCRAKYVYVASVGDTITREGISTLFAVAERFNADVVISPPRMIDVRGRAKKKLWPIHKLLAQLGETQPFTLEPGAGQLFVTTFVQRGILGSSASNLYRTDVLQRFPFRTDFGTAGDLAWGLEHAGEIRLAIVPRSFSTFTFHPKSYARRDYAVNDLNEKCLALATEVVRRRSLEKPTGLVKPESHS